MMAPVLMVERKDDGGGCKGFAIPFLQEVLINVTISLHAREEPKMAFFLHCKVSHCVKISFYIDPLNNKYFKFCEQNHDDHSYFLVWGARPYLFHAWDCDLGLKQTFTRLNYHRNIE